MAIIKKKAAEEVKAAPVTETVKAAPKAKKAAPAKAEKKAPAGKRAAAPAVKLFVQYQGKQISQEDILAAVQSAWTGDAIQTLELYVKPEDGAVYYVVNGTERGKVEF